MSKKKSLVRKALDYLYGNLVYQIYYCSYLAWIIPNHIFEQVNMRIVSMNQECLNSGSCKECGCKTTALQMIKDRCDGNCYPSMMSKRAWKKFNEHKIHVEGIYTWRIVNGTIKLMK